MTPTLSQVRNWDTEHLTAAADHWTKTATVWEDRFTRYATHVNNPGGTPWEGAAADAAQQRAHSDRMTVIGLADQLHDASAIARSGAVEIAEACRLVLRSADAAERAGFTVGEDFSVIDRHVYNMRAAAARQAQAAGFAADLRATVADLVAVDARVASQITTATTGLGNDPFAEPGSPPPAEAGRGAQKAVTDTLLGNVADGRPAAPTPGGDTLLGGIASHPGSSATDLDRKELFSWSPSPADVATGTAAGIAAAAHDYALDKASEVTSPGDPLLKWTREFEIKDAKLPGFTRAGGVLGFATAVPAGIIDYSEAKDAGKSTARAVGEALAREGGATATGLAAGSVASAIAADMAAGAAIGSVIPGAGTAAGLVAGFVFGGAAAFLTSKGLAWAFSG